MARLRAPRAGPLFAPWAIAVLWLLWGAASAAVEPFDVQRLQVPGRPLQAFAVSDDAGTVSVVVLSVEGAAPDERGHLSIFGADGRRTVQLAVPRSVVGVDAADLDGAAGIEVVLLSADALEVRAPGRPEPLRVRPFQPPLPLPPRTRGLSRLRLLRAWEGNGALSALVPTMNGVRHIPLTNEDSSPLRIALTTNYVVNEASSGIRVDALNAAFEWPQFALGDDDGDGRDDLFALARYGVSVFRSGPEGLPPAPSRHAELRPFSPTEELRYEATSLSQYARDLDGDGLTDLVLHRTIGTLFGAHATTTIFRNPGTGADPTRPPDARIEGDGGFGAIFIDDFDGDGRLEALQSLVSFDVLQVVRILVTEKAQIRFRLLHFDEPGLGTPTVTWEDALTLPLDFERGTVAGILPNLAGDWNGDGLHDLLFSERTDRLALRLGERGSRGLTIGPLAARQDVSRADGIEVADLDGDGLDDAVLWDSRDASGGLQLLRNRGVLARTPPSLHAPTSAARGASAGASPDPGE